MILLLALLFFVYVKLIFKRPAIRETTERKKLEVTHEKTKLDNSKTVFFTLEPITVNIASTPIDPNSDTDQGLKRMHYVSIGIAFEIRDEKFTTLFEVFKPYILDRLIFLLGKKTYDQLATIQGRYILQSEIQDATNKLIASKAAQPPRDPPVMRTFFNQLIVD